MFDQKQTQLPSRPAFVAPDETLSSSKHGVESDRIVSRSQEKDSRENCLDSSDGLDISGRKYAEVWGPSLVSLENKNNGINSARRNNDNFRKKTHFVSENSNINTNMPSSFTAEKSEKSQLRFETPCVDLIPKNQIIRTF